VDSAVADGDDDGEGGVGEDSWDAKRLDPCFLMRRRSEVAKVTWPMKR
jgi:hypothetical protein